MWSLCIDSFFHETDTTNTITKEMPEKVSQGTRAGEYTIFKSNLRDMAGMKWIRLRTAIYEYNLLITFLEAGEISGPVPQTSNPSLRVRWQKEKEGESIKDMYSRLGLGPIVRDRFLVMKLCVK